MKYHYDKQKQVWVNEDYEEFTQDELDQLEAKLEQLKEENAE